MSPEIGRLLEPLIRAWREEGAQAVVLVGSHARGAAGPGSDVDVVVVGDGSHSGLDVRDGVLVSVSWVPEPEQRARMYEPMYLATHVAGWRDAIVLEDPEGVAASIVSEARAWSWELVADRCDSWAAERVSSFAEEVLKLAAALERRDDVLAAAERDILVIHLALPIALRHRILFTSENELWERVGSEAGTEWSGAQSAALAVNGEDLPSSCRGALRLFERACGELDPLFDERQRRVVDLALRAADAARHAPA
jgi:hypothetical protein